MENYTEYLEFNCSLTSFINDTFNLKFNFSNPLIFHSEIDVRDLIQITILKPKLFIVKEEIGVNYFISNQSLQDFIAKNNVEFKNDSDIHKENFIKFLSDSRDWAYQYIEDVQSGLKKFADSVQPEIDYFKKYGDLTSMKPNYNSLKKITEAYEELLTLLPKEEEVK